MIPAATLKQTLNQLHDLHAWIPQLPDQIRELYYPQSPRTHLAPNPHSGSTIMDAYVRATDTTRTDGPDGITSPEGAQWLIEEHATQLAAIMGKPLPCEITCITLAELLAAAAWHPNVPDATMYQIISDVKQIWSRIAALTGHKPTPLDLPCPNPCEGTQPCGGTLYSTPTRHGVTHIKCGQCGQKYETIQEAYTHAQETIMRTPAPITITTAAAWLHQPRKTIAQRVHDRRLSPTNQRRPYTYPANRLT